MISSRIRRAEVAVAVSGVDVVCHHENRVHHSRLCTWLAAQTSVEPRPDAYVPGRGGFGTEPEVRVLRHHPDGITAGWFHL